MPARDRSRGDSGGSRRRPGRARRWRRTPGAMLAMVARSASPRSAHPVPKNSTNLPTTPCLRSICVTVSTRSVAVVPAGSWPVRRQPTTTRHAALVERLAEQHGLGLDAADAPAEDAEPVDHRRVRVGADQRVGEGDVVPPSARTSTTLRQELEVHLVHDARARRDDAEVLERLLTPAQQERSARGCARARARRSRRTRRATEVRRPARSDRSRDRRERAD